MDGDLTRGHRPDAKRGKSYRRVLVQQGAAILDSDLAAMVDANERMVREAVTHSACRRGSPDLGFLVTPGELLALFDPIEGAEVTPTAPAEAVRDFSRKYLDRYPGLRIRGGGGTVAVPLRRELSAATDCIVWLRADGGATARVNGTSIAVPAGTTYAAFLVSLSGTALSFEPDTAQPYWVAMVETAAPSGPSVALHWAAGEYQIGGVIAKTAGAAWPGLPDPAGAALEAASEAPAGTRMVAYLEVWERHVTGVEDAGIVEQALGGDHDTSSRSEVAAQVKLAPVAPGGTADTVAAAIMAPALPGGTVALGTAAETIAADPCDLPVPGGYTGVENRLYRIVVHDVTTGAGARTLFKWSRENGSELFLVAGLVGDPVTGVTVGAELPLRQGDLVELLSDASDFGDAVAGAVGPGGFRRPVRRQGRLVRLHGGGATDQATRTFTLREPDGSPLVSPIPAGPIGTAGIKLRRWSGLAARPGTGALTANLEDGIQAAIDGEFEPGDWWQYEARALAENANGPAVVEPHGPERLFAPLALLEQTPPGAPVRLVAWLDARYRRFCEMEADAVAYDGDRAGTDADTVQEALDELYLRVSDGCGEIAVPPDVSIQDVIDAIPPGGSAKICLNAGTRDLPARIRVAGKGDLVITGIGPGTLLRRTQRLVFEFDNCRSIDLRDFAIESQGSGAGALFFHNVGEVKISGLSIRTAGGGGAAIHLMVAGGTAERSVTITGNSLSLGHGDSGMLLVEPDHVIVRDNIVAVREQPFEIASVIDTPPFLAAVGNVLIDRVDFHGDDSEDFDFVGSPVFKTTPPGPGRFARTGVVMANGMWGRPIMTFTTHRELSDHDWEQIAEANRAPNGVETASAGMVAFLRRFRSRLARAMFGLSGGDPATVPSTVRFALDRLRDRIIASNEAAHGIAGIVVAMNRTASKTRAGSQMIATLFPLGRGKTVRVSGNRVSGFVQGIRIAASALDPRRDSEQGRRLFWVLHSADVIENHIELRLPLQAHQRHGIMVGNTLAARVVGNRVENLAYFPRRGDEVIPDIDCDGIRLWGIYGPLVEVRGNLTYGTTVGVRFINLAQPEPLDGRRDVFAQVFADNGYIGDGAASVIRRHSGEDVV